MPSEVITVEGIGPYGPRANGAWYGIGKRAEFGPNDFEKGKSYVVDIWTAQSGKKYINSFSPANVGNSVTALQVQPYNPPPPPFSPPVKSSGGGWGGNDPDIQDRIARNTAYQKATDGVSRVLMPYIVREEDVVPKLKAHIEELAQWLYSRIKNEQTLA